MPTPLALSDDQLSAIMSAAKPLQPHVRSAFVEAVVAALAGHELGDGAVHRAIAEAQRGFLSASERMPVGAKWAR